MRIPNTARAFIESFDRPRRFLGISFPGNGRIDSYETGLAHGSQQPGSPIARGLKCLPLSEFKKALARMENRARTHLLYNECAAFFAKWDNDCGGREFRLYVNGFDHPYRESRLSGAISRNQLQHAGGLDKMLAELVSGIPDPRDLYILSQTRVMAELDDDRAVRAEAMRLFQARA